MKRLALWLLSVTTCVSGWPGGTCGLLATEYWVSASGNNAANGSKEQPFLTIRRGVEAAAPGDTVYVRAGRYEEHVNVLAGKSGEPGKWLTIAAAPGEERLAVVGTEEAQID